MCSPRDSAACGRSCWRRLLALLNHRIHPVIPARGSVGASGDLAPLAHLALAIIGEGQVLFDGRQVPAAMALLQAGLSPLVLEAKEGLALLNGTQAITAVGALALGAGACAWWSWPTWPER